MYQWEKKAKQQELGWNSCKNSKSIYLCSFLVLHATAIQDWACVECVLQAESRKVPSVRGVHSCPCVCLFTGNSEVLERDFLLWLNQSGERKEKENSAAWWENIGTILNSLS